MKVLLGLFLGAVFFIFLAVIASVTYALLERLYAFFPETPSERYKTFAGLSGTIVALVGVVAGLITFILSTWYARRAQRKQHTITVLLETRLSEEFRSLIERRRAVFPEFMDVSFQDWQAARNAVASDTLSEDEAKVKRDGASALIHLLNYYEFLAVGIDEGDLDAKMLKNTIRGIMCNLVDDARHVVAGMRRSNKNIYKNLKMLYEDWRVDGATDFNGNPNERPIPD